MAKDPTGSDTSQVTETDDTLTPNRNFRNLQRMHRVLKTSPAVLFRWLAAEYWPVEYVSDNVNQFGYSADELLSGKVTFGSIVHPEDFRRISQEAKELTQKGIDRFVQEYRIITKDGRVRWLDDRTVVERDRDGNITHYQGVVLDITDRKTVEQQWMLTQYAVDHSAAAIMRVRSDASIAYVNRTACRQLGYREEELLAMTVADIDSQYTKSYWKEDGLERLRRNGTITFETQYIRKDGSRLPVEVVLYVTLFERKEYFYAFVTNITERKRTEHQLKAYSDQLESTVETRTHELTKAKEQAEASSIAKSNFLSHMSHELRTPLNAILGFSRLMERDPNLTDKQAENLALIHQSGEHLLKLINGVLDMSRIDAGLESLDIQTIDLPQFVQGVTVMFKSRASDLGLTFMLDLMPELPQFVRCDERKLQQILINLMDNSLKFTDTGGIDVKVWSSELPSAPIKENAAMNSGTIELFFRIRDTGKGINPEYLDQIFDPFFKGDTDDSTAAGTGLGLAISRNFANLMGGDITATNRDGPGADFTVNIQVGLAAETQFSLAKPTNRVVGIDSTREKRRILVVDDNDTSRLLLRELLDEVGFDIKEAENGQKAVASFFEWHPHLVFMDIQMPVMDGLSALKIIKNTESGKDTPVIALTAHAFEEERRKITAAGFDAFIHKPLVEKELFEVIAAHLDLTLIVEETQQPQPRPKQQITVPGFPIGEFAELPISLLKNLRQKALELDLERINTCIDNIQDLNASLGNTLKSLSKGFRFNDILDLTEKAIKLKGSATETKPEGKNGSRL